MITENSGAVQRPTADPSTERSDALDLRVLQDFIWRRWKFILMATSCVLAISFLVLLTLTPRYTATAQVLLDPRKERIFGTESLFPEMSLDTGTVDSQISIIQSISLLRRVVEKERITEDSEFAPQPGNRFMQYLARLISEDPILDNPKGTSQAQTGLDLPPNVRATILRLRAALEVQRVARTYVITIAMTSKDRAKAARLANAIADAYVVDQLDARYESARRASSWLAERMEGLSAQLRSSEEALNDFRRQHNIVSTSGDARTTISEQQLSELNGKLMTARADTAEKRAKFEQANDVQAKNGNLQAIPDVVRSQVISNLRTQQAEVARREADLVSRYNDQHPLVINARAERRDIERSIAAEVSRIISNLSNDYDVAKAREQSLQSSLDEVTGASGLNSDVGIRLRELERASTSNRIIYDSFLSRAKITTEQSSLQEREARLISPATMPGSASFPKYPLFLSLATLAGLLLGICGAVALDMLNSGFSSAREIEERLGIAVLASVPLLKDRERKLGDKVVDPTQFLIAKPLSRYAEAVRAIRVGIQMSDVDHPAKVILVTSSIPNEGKSTLAVSLAFSAIKAGLKVLIIDGDLRHPTTSEYFSLEQKPGLVDILTGAVPSTTCTYHAEGLSIIGAGTKSQNPPDLLGSERMKQLIAATRDAYDYVVIDSPPLGPVIDAKILASLADKIVFVVRWQDTTRELVGRTVEWFARDRKIAGIALNLVDNAKTPRYGPYSHYDSSYYRSYYQG